MQPAPEQTLIVVADPRAWFIHAVDALLPGSARPREPAVGAHASASVHADAEVSPSAAIGERVVIGPGTRVGPGAVIYADCTIGANCCIGPGAVIGWVGLAYHQDIDGRRAFFPHLGGVRIGDWVDIGAHSCVCRGMLSDTTVGHSVKVGSLVYLSHGTTVGDHAWVSASAAVAGHASIGANAVLGIGAVVIDNVALEPGVIVGGGGVVTRAAKAGEKLVGAPARHALCTASVRTHAERPLARPAAGEVGEVGDQRGEEPEGDPGPALVDQRAAEREQQEYAGKNAGGDFAQPDAAARLAAVNGDEHRLDEHERQDDVDHHPGGKELHHGRYRAPLGSPLGRD